MAEERVGASPVEGSIGMSLSGGGYRAAAFHLGSLAYLDALGLRGQLTQLSTVSGGTFIGAAYTRSLVEEVSFEEFFRDFYHFLRDTNLVERALDRLGRHAPSVASGRQDLIVSAARVYAETFMQGADGKPWLFGAVLDADIPLREAVFNATEFRHGIAFRFQRSADSQARIGNFYFNVPRSAAARIRMADIVAASSCFPGGFEPLAFPDDFAWPEGSVPPELRELFPEPVGLMDGGIYDNPGLESLLLADRRDPQELGMILISDVDQHTDDLYPFPEKLSVGVAGRLRLGWLNLLARLVTLTCFATVGVVAYLWWSQGLGGFWNLLAYAVPVLLAGATGFGIHAARRFLGEAMATIPRSGGTGWNDLRRLSVDQVANMLNLRVSSLLAMTGGVFMKRIRQLVFGLVYGDESYKGKVVANLIYDLQTGGRGFDEELPEEVRRPSPQLQRVIDVAAAMPTTLWFTEDAAFQQPSLVACGQANLAYNLMRWVRRRQADHDSAALQELWRRLVSDWNELVADPYALLRKRLPGEPLPPPPTVETPPGS